MCTPAVQCPDPVRVDLGPVQPDVDVFRDPVPHDLSVFDAIMPDGVLAHAHVNRLSPTEIRTTIVGWSGPRVPATPGTVSAGLAADGAFVPVPRVERPGPLATA